MADASVLLCYDNNPGYIAPPRFSSRQTTVCKHYSDLLPIVQPDVAVDRIMPPDEFDISGLTAANGARFDCVIVFCSRFGPLPRNLDVGSAKKVMVLSDTHHGPGTMGDIVRYAREEGFHNICTLYNRGQLHWFAEWGLSTGWFPGLLVKSIAMEWQQERRPFVLFCGQSGPSHPIRSRRIKFLQDNNVPVHAGLATNLTSRKLYAAHQISLNSSLNGDLNLRVLETICSGGFLLTDRLAQVSGLSLLFEPGREYDDFGDDIELLEKARHYLGHPETALEMARRAHDRYWARYRQGQIIAEFMAWIENSETPGHLPPNDEWRVRIGRQYLASQDARLALYARAQDIHLRHERIIARADEKSCVVALADLCDLPGAEIVVSPAVLQKLDLHDLGENRARISARPLTGDDLECMLEYDLPSLHAHGSAALQITQ